MLLFGFSSAILACKKAKKGAEGQTRTVDTGIFSAVLYRLSYLGLGHLLSNPSYWLSRLQVSLPKAIAS